MFRSIRASGHRDVTRSRGPGECSGMRGFLLSRIHLEKILMPRIRVDCYALVLQLFSDRAMESLQKSWCESAVTVQMLLFIP